MADPITTLPVGSPEWWLLRLLRRLEDRHPRLITYQNYYEGVQPLAFASEKFEQAFGHRFPVFTSNFCSLVVEGISEREVVQGFRFGNPAGDADVWDLWQENDLDEGSQLAHLEAAIKGSSYALVEPPADPGGVPIITIEDALDAIVETDPKDRRKRRAGLKRWTDDEGMLVVVVYLPEAVYKYRTKARWTDTEQAWLRAPEASGVAEGLPSANMTLWAAAGFQRYQPPGDEDWPLPNPIGVVPLVELPNRPRLKGSAGQSEVKPVMSNQDAVNKYRCDALIASEFAAFPQRYLLNFEPEVDPETGRSIEPFKAAIDRLWVVPPPDPEEENPAQPTFGQFAAASLEPYSGMISMEVGHISAISRLPYHYLLGTPQTIPPSGESLKASEAGLEHKVGRIKLHMGGGWEEVMRVTLLAKGDARGKLRTAETIWTDSETRNEAVRTDSIVKLHSEGIIDDELAWEMAGLTPQQVARMLERRAAAEAEAAAAAAEGGAGEPTTEPAPGGPPATVVPAPTGPRFGSPPA